MAGGRGWLYTVAAESCLTAEQINSIHRLHWAEHWSVRKIARHLHLARRTISQYLVTPARSAACRQRASKLDPFKSTIAELLEQDAKASAMVIAQRLGPLGFIVAYNMGEWREIPQLLKLTKTDISIWLVTFALTVFADLTL